MLADNKRIYLGTEGGGLFEYDGKKLNRDKRALGTIKLTRILLVYMKRKEMRFMSLPVAGFF